MHFKTVVNIEAEMILIQTPQILFLIIIITARSRIIIVLFINII